MPMRSISCSTLHGASKAFYILFAPTSVVTAGIEANNHSPAYTHSIFDSSPFVVSINFFSFA